MGHAEEAMAYLEEAMAIAEGVRARCAGAARVQSGSFGSQSLVYETAIDFLHDMHEDDGEGGHDRRAFQVAQRAKGRSFLDMLTESEVDLRGRADPEYRRREQEVLTRIAELLEESGAEEDTGATAASVAKEVEIARLEEELELVEVELREADPRYAEVVYPKPCTVEEVQAVLGEGEVLVEYLLGDSASHAFIVTPSAFRFAALPPRATIEEKARRLLPMIRDYNVLGDNPAYFVATATPLSSALLGPLADEIDEARRLIVTPSGILHYLPFEALLIGEVPPPRDVDRFDAVPYLAGQVDIAYVPSATAFVQMRSHAAVERQDSARSERILLVGDPAQAEKGNVSVFARRAAADAGPVPFAAAEIDEIDRLFSEEEIVRLTGEDATTAMLDEATSTGSFRLAHFAAHGTFNENRPQFSGLLLAPDPDSGSDGFLTIGEIFGLSLECEQVVLSSCSSALGEVVRGEGITGLTRAFLYAGASNVIASLWEVSGEGAAELMKEFYVLLEADGGSDPAGALAEARRRMITGAITPDDSSITYAHPYFWAPFILTGPGM